MRTSSALCAVLALVLAFARTDTALPSDLPADIMFGVKGGYSQVIGHYADFVHGAGGGGVFVMPYIGSFFMIEADLSYASYALARERGSSLNLASGGIGPLFYVQPFSFLQIYVGASITGNYFALNASRERGEQESMKAGFAGKFGFIFPFRNGLAARIGCEYAQAFQSGNAFAAVNYYGGVAYGVSFWNAPPAVSEAETAFAKGQREFKEGRFDEAKRSFAKTRSLDGSHAGAKQHLDTIERLERQYATARDLIAKHRFYEAIPVLDDIAAEYPAAREDLAKARAQLAGEIPTLARQGIAAYERQDYRTCIALMQRIILIDPKNETANIYLPRARKRLEALERLR
ncbi:MAG TPA: hypothetical protein PLE73_07965 [Spirochaetota bacterium]|nr:hypothetical protein [Spirochaetota bacterium]HPI23118.1 hypothetical protein [Spirochaetota bacterium]HPU88056.1 hypothetical protein [Spirochaetota bacterium]